MARVSFYPIFLHIADSAIENAFTVLTDHGPVKFMCNEQMLYVHVPTKLLKSPSGVLTASPADPGVLTSCRFSVVHPWSRDHIRTDVRNVPVSRVDQLDSKVGMHFWSSR